METKITPRSLFKFSAKYMKNWIKSLETDCRKQSLSKWFGCGKKQQLTGLAYRQPDTTLLEAGD